MLSCQGICGQTRKCKRAVCVSNRARVSRYRSTQRHFSSCDLIRIKKLKPFFLKLILFRKINSFPYEQIYPFNSQFLNNSPSIFFYYTRIKKTIGQNIYIYIEWSNAARKKMIEKEKFRGAADRWRVFDVRDTRNFIFFGRIR